MRSLYFVFIFLMMLCTAMALADGQGTPPSACEKNLDISALPAYTQLVQSNLPDLVDYFSCQAAVKNDIQVCNIFSNGSSEKADCLEAYSDYYATFGRLYQTKQLPDQFLNMCMEKFSSKQACLQWGDIMLSGNTDNCDKIVDITPNNIALCKDMASMNPSGTKAFFMMALRKGDPAFCDQISFSPAAAVCKGLLSKGVDGCQLNAGAIRFKNLYCQHLTT